MKIKYELKFGLRKYFTNGFTIWAFVMLFTYLTRTEPIIAKFRTSLWFYNTMWIFFVPLITQVGFEMFTKIKRMKKFHWFSKKQVLYTIAISGL